MHTSTRHQNFQLLWASTGWYYLLMCLHILVQQSQVIAEWFLPTDCLLEMLLIACFWHKTKSHCVECGHSCRKHPHKVSDYNQKILFKMNLNQVNQLPSRRYLIKSLMAGASMTSHLSQGEGASHSCCPGQSRLNIVFYSTY